MVLIYHSYLFFFFNDTATTEIYTLSLHDALPICDKLPMSVSVIPSERYSLSLLPLSFTNGITAIDWILAACRSEEHTSELQSQSNLVCRLLLEKKKKFKTDDVENILIAAQH